MISGTALAIDKSINFFKKCFLILPLSLDRVELYLQTKTVIEKRWLRVQIVFLKYFKINKLKYGVQINKNMDRYILHSYILSASKMIHTKRKYNVRRR